MITEETLDFTYIGNRATAQRISANNTERAFVPAEISCGRVRRTAQLSGFSTRLNYLTLLLFTLGFVTGCVAWQKYGKTQWLSLTDGLSVMGEMSDKTGFVGSVLSDAWALLPFVALVVLSAFMTFGYVLAPVVLFVKGLGSASVLCVAFGSGYSVSALLIAAYIILSGIVLSLMAAQSVVMSGRLVSRTATADKYRGEYVFFVIRIVVLSLLLLCLSAARVALGLLIVG